MKRSLKIFGLSLVIAALGVSVLAQQNKDPDKDYDRLDGTGSSGKTVHVIEWEGNLEVHVYPKGSLKGLALKIDDRDQDRPVMVMGYRFDTDPKHQVIRRNVLGIPMAGFKAYTDPSASDYDKIVVSRNPLAALKPFTLDPAPTQLYPEGHPMNQATNPLAQGGSQPAVSGTATRTPASAVPSKKEEVPPTADLESGAIRSFFSN